MSDHADLLRRAAAKARETATAATEGPWTNLNRGDHLVHLRDDGEFDYVVDEPMSHEGNATHIALWHPGVALAVADLLEDAADMADNAESEFIDAPLAAIARALLNHPEEN